MTYWVMKFVFSERVVKKVRERAGKWPGLPPAQRPDARRRAGTEAALGDLMRSRRVTVGAMARASTVASTLCDLTEGARI